MSIHRRSPGGSAQPHPPHPQGAAATWHPPPAVKLRGNHAVLPPERDTPLLTFHWPEHITWPGLALTEKNTFPSTGRGAAYYRNPFLFYF